MIPQSETSHRKVVLEPFRHASEESGQADEANKQAYAAALSELKSELQDGSITIQRYLAEEKKLNSTFNPTGRLRS